MRQIYGQQFCSCAQCHENPGKRNRFFRGESNDAHFRIVPREANSVAWSSAFTRFPSRTAPHAGRNSERGALPPKGDYFAAANLGSAGLAVRGWTFGTEGPSACLK